MNSYLLTSLLVYKGKKGWNRWQASSNRAKSAKPYINKGTKKPDKGD
ncbi:DUF3934 domain-containing protein [Peribacillus asahii]